MKYIFVYQLRFSLALTAVINGPENRLLAQIGAKNGRQRRAHAFLLNVFFFAPFSIN